VVEHAAETTDAAPGTAGTRSRAVTLR
jgi:hypothetical protein